jgi:hypothetical protein
LKIPKFPDNRLFSVLVNRTVIFFLAMCLISLFLYVTGTVQGFMDETQLFLLRLGVALSILLAFSSVYGLMLELILFFRKRRPRFIFGAGIYFLLGILGAAIAAAAGFILSASSGNI